jgi:UDP-N-acetylglucosamine--N-acetylmuramyl-(pentapeptide) pyrophosphoryl-undecaprenol N-acetylglucosamine transferase
VSFEDTLRYTKPGKGIHTGSPIRPELYGGDRERAKAFTGLDGRKPVLMVMGGSLGAAAVNEGVRKALPELTKRFDVVHLCGKGKVDESVRSEGYRQFEYVGPELPDMFAATGVMISRAGANAVFEFIALGIPALLVPLPLEASRGDQILNAEYVTKKGYAAKLDQADITPERLVREVNALYDRRESMAELMKADPLVDGTEEVLDEIFKAAGVK